MKGYEKVKELIEGELGNYPYFDIGEIKLSDSYSQTEEDEYYEVDISCLRHKKKTLYFHYDRNKEKIEIELGEDNWEEVEDFSSKIKYFWMALLTW